MHHMRSNVCHGLSLGALVAFLARRWGRRWSMVESMQVVHAAARSSGLGKHAPGMLSLLAVWWEAGGVDAQRAAALSSGLVEQCSGIAANGCGD